MAMQRQDPIQALRDAGVPVDALNEEQRAALAELSEQELNTLLDIRRRVEDAGEVQGYAGIAICLLRLGDPHHRYHQLSRRGFRYQRIEAA